jgi:SOS regulatory protein LexA
MDRLATLKRFYHRHHRLPSFAEMLKLFGVKSKQAVFRYMQAWLESGIVEKTVDGKYTPGPSLRGLPLLGTIGAGFPSPAEEELADAITLDQYLIHNRAASFMVRVTGDSMINAGIQTGDLVIVERSRTPKSGDIVVANVDAAWTLKRYMKQGNKIWLQAENRHYPNIHPATELQIEGVVTGVVRKYH